MDDAARPDPPLAGDEAATLLGFLDHQRATLAWKCDGLTDAQLRQRLEPTDMTLGGLLLHLARVEDGWFTEVVGRQPPPEPWAGMPWAAEWQSAAGHTGEQLRRTWSDRVQASRRVVAEALADGPAGLAVTHPARDGQAEVSLRWVLVHMVEEYARHNGHADLLRQAVDGATGE